MKFVFALFSAILLNVAQAQPQLRVMYYNLLNFPGSTPNRADTLKVIVDYVQPDVLLVCELSSQTGADLVLNTVFNANGTTAYERAQFIDGPDTDNMIFFNAEKFGLSSRYIIPTALRNIGAYQLYCKTPDIATTTDTVFLNFFVAHLKASSGSANESLRALEVMQLKNALADNATLENIFFGGDFNLYSSSEPAWDNILNGAGYALYDPISMPGTWNNSTFASIHTQSTRDTQFGGGAYGGMDDRFDFIFFNQDLLDNAKDAAYVDGSYHTVGQDGLRYNGSIISPANQAVPAEVASALYYMSDHLPVALDVSVERYIQDTTSVLEISNSANLEAYIQGKTLVLKKAVGTVSIQVLSIDGKVVMNFNSTQNSTIQLNELSVGNYIIRAKDAVGAEATIKYSALMK